MGAESGLSILEPRLSKTGAAILETAVVLSSQYGSGVATIESLYASLVNHQAVSPVAKECDLDPDSAVSFVSFSKPQGFGTRANWDKEVDEVIAQAHQGALERGARKAGLVDVVNVVAQHEVVSDLYFRSPAKIQALTELAKRFKREECYRKEIAS